MLKLNSILKEIKDIPEERLDDLYSFVHSLNTKTKKTSSSRKKILSFAGSFSDMSEKDYRDFIAETKKTRINLFNRSL